MGEGALLRADLARELQTRGREINITRTTPGTYDQDAGTTGTSTEETHHGRGRVGNYRDSQVDGELIRRGDRVVTWQPDVDHESFVPKEKDVVSFGDEIASIVSVKRREVGEEWFAYTLQIRR